MGAIGTKSGTSGAAASSTTFTYTNSSSNALLTVSGGGNCYWFGMLFWISNINFPSVVPIASDRISVSINAGTQVVTISTSAGATNLNWNIVYLGVPGYLGANYNF